MNNWKKNLNDCDGEVIKQLRQCFSRRDDMLERLEAAVTEYGGGKEITLLALQQVAMYEQTLQMFVRNLSLVHSSELGSIAAGSAKPAEETAAT